MKEVGGYAITGRTTMNEYLDIPNCEITIMRSVQNTYFEPMIQSCLEKYHNIVNLTSTVAGLQDN